MGDEPGRACVASHTPSCFLHLRVQERLCRELNITAERALDRSKLAPLMRIRDIAMMGLLHRIILDDAPTQLKKLFPFAVLR